MSVNGRSPMEDVVIVSAARTPVGAFNGAFATLPAHKLGEIAIKSALERAKLAAEELCGVSRGSAECACDIGHIGNDGLDTISFSFDFGGHDRHANRKS